MTSHSIVFHVFLIFGGAAALSTLALYTRQSLLVAYIVLGAMLGPWGLKYVSDVTLVQQTGDVGILFLLFLLGLHLQPQNLLHMLRKVTSLALISSILFLMSVYFISRLFGFSAIDSLVIGAAMMFSSTIIGLKLLPTTILHHQHTGEVMISVLLMQDLIAIVVLIVLNGVGGGSFAVSDLLGVFISLPALCIGAFVIEKYLLVRLLAKFDRTQEYIFLLSIGWCLGVSVLAKYMGLSEDIGAFVAGVSLAASPISLYIAESLKPLRDFFLVMFFFSVGATFNFNFLPEVLLPALMVSIFLMLFKPFVYQLLLHRGGETKQVSKEVGVRLGQASEFSLLVASIAIAAHVISDKAVYLIQAATILTFIVSSYLVVMVYPTPVALTDKMRKD